MFTVVTSGAIQPARNSARRVNPFCRSDLGVSAVSFGSFSRIVGHRSSASCSNESLLSPDIRTRPAEPLG